MPTQTYWKFDQKKKKKKKKKNESFQIKADILYISAQNINCWCALRGGSNAYQQSMFWAEIRKIMYMYTLVNHSFLV